MRGDLRALRCLLGAFLTLFAAASASAQTRTIIPETTVPTFYADSWAVIIGINDYQHPRVPKLRYAVNDARAVEATLVSQGFRRDRIITLLDRRATKTAIEEVLGDELRSKVGKDDRLLVFFAGHGKTDKLRSGEEEGYLIPVDGDPSKLFSTAISMTALRQISDRLPAKHILYVVDACYSGYAIYNRAISDDLLQEMVRKPAIQILTAGRQDDQAQERGGHGVFTDVLVRGLQGDAFAAKGWLALEELGLWIKQRVFAESGRKQLPQYGNLAGEGQFIFLRPTPQQVAVQPRPPLPEPSVREEIRPQVGSLGLTSSLEGFEVWLDGRRIGVTKADRTLLVENLTVGPHRIKASKAGHRDWEREVQIQANRRLDITIDIEVPKMEPPRAEMAKAITREEFAARTRWILGVWEGSHRGDRDPTRFEFGRQTERSNGRCCVGVLFSAEPRTIIGRQGSLQKHPRRQWNSTGHMTPRQGEELPVSL